MNNKILLAIIVIIIILLGGAYYNNKQKADLDLEKARDAAIEEETNRSRETVTTQYKYEEQEHIFSGVLMLPTPCHNYDAEVIKRENETEIAFNIFDPTQDSDLMCAQVIVEKTFMVSFEGEYNDNIIATINGELVNLNIFEVEAGTNFEDVDLYIKG